MGGMMDVRRGGGKGGRRVWFTCSFARVIVKEWKDGDLIYICLEPNRFLGRSETEGI